MSPPEARDPLKAAAADARVRADARSGLQSGARVTPTFNSVSNVQLIYRVMFGNEVTLEGKVRSWYERGRAEDAAWMAPGVRSVVDHLSVG